MDRRAFLIGSAALAGCTPSAAPARADVFAAGQPAAVLVWALAPGRLAGWPRKPSDKALALLPSKAATLPETGALTSGGRPASLEAVAASRPRLILDYGDKDPVHEEIAQRVRSRLGTDYLLIDGKLRLIPEALATTGARLGVAERGRTLAATARDVLDRWGRVKTGPGFYYARGADGLETGFAGSLATEVLEGAGWTNVAKAEGDIERVSREQVAAWDPEVLVTLDRRFAEAATSDDFWRRRRDRSRRRLVLVPDAPFGWLDRPPSINRLLGCAWLASANPFGEADAADPADYAALNETLFGKSSGVTASPPAPRWIA